MCVCFFLDIIRVLCARWLNLFGVSCLIFSVPWFILTYIGIVWLMPAYLGMIWIIRVCVRLVWCTCAYLHAFWHTLAAIAHFFFDIWLTFAYIRPIWRILHCVFFCFLLLFVVVVCCVHVRIWLALAYAINICPLTQWGHIVLSLSLIHI